MAFTPILTAEALNQLLAALSKNQVAAVAAYTKLRESLIRFFQIKGDSDPEESADVTLDRVALKLSQNIEIPDLTKFSFGVARLVFLERIKIEKKNKIAAAGFYADKLLPKPAAEANDFSSLRECFNHLADAEKQLLREYYIDISPKDLFARRKQLQHDYDISLSGLRVKVFRLRERLENCLKEKLTK
jgi:hypothetical protein